MDPVLVTGKPLLRESPSPSPDVLLRCRLLFCHVAEGSRAKAVAADTCELNCATRGDAQIVTVTLLTISPSHVDKWPKVRGLGWRSAGCLS